MTNFPTINWVTKGADFNDYRPAIGPDGQSVVFERSSPSSSEPKLYKVNSLTGKPAPFLQLNGWQTRPDWCWATDMLAFNSTKKPLVRTMEATSKVSTLLNGTEGFVYPQWSIDGSALTVMNTSSNAGAVVPCSSIIDLQGGVQVANINGGDANGTPVYGGMPAVNPNSIDLIAFAGQPALAAWNPPGSTPYNQENNYIFLNSSDGAGNFSSSPMEIGAPIDNFVPAFQGRAPAWSPNGQYVVFESTRIGHSFALFLMDLNGSGPAVQLTDTVYRAQHAKFFPDGQNLIFCAKQKRNPHNAIAWIDISGFVS